MSEVPTLSEAEDVAKSLEASLNSVCNRYANTSPDGASIELDVGVVRWSMPEASAAEMKDSIANRIDDGGPRRTMASFERETAAAVAEAMHRKISGRFWKKVKDGVATEVFVLETIPPKN